MTSSRLRVVFFILLLAVGFVLLTPSILVAQVDTAWVRRYDGPAHSTDYATHIAVDSQSNVVVAGASRGADSTYDWVVIKYSPSGDSLWASRRNFGGNDFPSGLGADSSGNVYVTGTGNDRIITVKYSPTGQVLWSLSHGSQGGAADLALDAGGNVLLVGSVEGVGVGNTITMKYRPTGETAWARTLSIGNGSSARAIAVSGQGGVYVASALYGSGSGADMMTVAYDSSGNRRWLATYSGPAEWDLPVDIAVDSTGNVYVTGSSEGLTSPWDYLTVKYNPLGETLWTRRYNGTADDWDEASAVAVDDSGNAYVTGYVTTPSSGQQCTTIKYGPAGETLWVARYARNEEHSAGYAVAVDETGCAYVTGGAAPAGVFSNCMTAKYSPAGDTLWTTSYDGPGNSVDYCSAMALGRDGSVCVTGLSHGAGGTNVDFVTIKYVQPGAVEEQRPASGAWMAVGMRGSVTRDELVMELPAAGGGDVMLSAYDMSGRCVEARVLQGQGRDVRYSFARLPAGVYVLRVRCAGQTQSFKVVKL